MSMRDNLFLESEREEEEEGEKNLAGKNGTYIELFVDPRFQCYFACPLLVACLCL